MTEADWQGGSTTWVSKTLTFNCDSYTIAAGRMLEVKFIVEGSAADDMRFAYDTASDASSVSLP